MSMIYSLCLAVQLTGQNLVKDSSFANNIGNQYDMNPDWTILTRDAAIIHDTRNSLDKHAAFIYSLDTSHSDFLNLNVLYADSKTRMHSGVVKCELASQMERDTMYNVSVWILPEEYIDLESIQVFFSEKSSNNPKDLTSVRRIDLKCADGSFIANKVTKVVKAETIQTANQKPWRLVFLNKWIKLQAIYKANGGEKYLYIGNIHDFKYFVYKRNRSGKKRKRARIKSELPFYYLLNQGTPLRGFEIDDVSVRKSVSNADCAQ